jgi:hypothetical protein
MSRMRRDATTSIHLVADKVDSWKLIGYVGIKEPGSYSGAPAFFVLSPVLSPKTADV